MARVKMLKYPKKPKASSSVQTKENYLKKVSDIDRENARRVADKKKSEKLTEKIRAVRKKTF